MSRTLLRSLAAALMALGWLGHPSTAPAARVLVMHRHGDVSVRNDPLIASFTPTPAPDRAAHATRTAHVAGINVRNALMRLRRRHEISSAAYRRYLTSFNDSLRTVKRLRGTRATELEAVIENLHGIAAAGKLTPSRLPALFLTLDQNRRWWTTGPLLSYGQRVEFSGSQLVWEYYPGQGIELQELGSFGPIDSLYHQGPKSYPRIRRLLNELIPLVADRGGGLAWEYYFHFDGGTPPWTSAMSQGTAIQALAEAYRAFHDPAYLALARRALPIFDERPPTGVSLPTPRGRWYLLYSFAPGAQVINGFLQALIGLHDYAKISGDAHAWELFHTGDAEAQAALPRYDTGAWSLYQLGQEDSLDYHQLVTSFLDQLCSRTRAPVYCTTAAHFRAYLKTPPALQLLTQRVAANATGRVAFRVSKIGRVGITVIHNGHALFLTSGDFGHGVHVFAIPALKHGSYTVRLDATDLAGNYAQSDFTLQVAGKS
jgi:hypothetical protein